MKQDLNKVYGWPVLFQNCICWHHPLSNMATT